MADTLCHATQGGLLLVAPFVSRIRKRVWLWILASIGAFFGALPDLIGAYGNLGHQDQWRMYVNAHFGPIAHVLRFVPMYGLHLFIDSLTHGPGKRWWVWNERMWLEILLWVLNGAVIWWMVSRWRRGKPARLQLP